MFETVCFVGNILGFIGVDLAGWANFGLVRLALGIRFKKVGPNNLHVSSDPKKPVIWLSNHRTFADFSLDHVLTGKRIPNIRVR